jgi:hypothetical protein
MFTFGMATVDISQGVDVGAEIIATLSEIQMAHKEASILCGYPATDRSGFSRALKGEQPLDLWRLRHLPLTFWRVFLPKFASALIREWFDAMHGDYRMVRASIRDKETKKEWAS